MLSLESKSATRPTLIFNFLRNFLSPALLLSVLLVNVTACSGGGSDDSPGEDRQALDGNACDVLGLAARSAGTTARIINGTDCRQSGAPVVRLQFQGALGPGFCSGIMITSTKVLTAAHCFVGAPNQIDLILGDAPDQFRAISAARWDVHPDFREGDLLENDAAVVVLSEPVGLPTLPLLLRTSVERGDVVSIFGYGTDENGVFDGIDLTSGDMRVAEVTTTHIRADFNGEGSNTCTGDSGGPLIAQVDGRSVVQGLTSSGVILECTEGDNSFFTNIQNPPVLDFLLRVAPDAEYF